MNAKTTVVLFVLVVVVGACIVLLKEKAPPLQPTLPPPAFSPGQIVDEERKQNLIDEDFGDAVQIVVRRPDQPEWRFQREAVEEDRQGDWLMTAPGTGRVQKWQIEQIGRRLTGLTYTVKYDADSPAEVTAANAGLEPPRVTVELTNQAGKRVEVHVGRQEGDEETYVRTGDSQTIYRVKPSLKNLLKNRALEYREHQLFDVPTDSIVRLAVTETPEDGKPTTYEMVQTGAVWRFEKPARAKAVPDEVRKLCSAFSALRVINWVEDQVEDPAVFGLGAEALTITVTAEAEADKASDDASTNGPDEQPAPVTREHTIRFARVGPLGEDNKVYVRRGDERLIGTVMKSVADTFKPNFKQWRDSRLIEVNPSTARRIELTVEEARATFVRSGSNWSYEESGDPADKAEIGRLLQALQTTKAANFVSGAASDPAGFGLDDPRGIIALTFDEDAEAVRIAIGGFADPKTQRLVYVRTGESDTVAKVRVTEANALLRKPVEFRDRTIIDVPPDRFEQISIQRPAQPHPDGNPSM